MPASWSRQEKQEPQGVVKSALNGIANGIPNGLSNGHTNGLSDDDHFHRSDQILSSNAINREEIAVRTVYGLVPLRNALHWPVHASYDELSRCATWMGGRIPTADEARSIYKYASGLKLKEVENKLGRTVPAVNG